MTATPISERTAAVRRRLVLHGVVQGVGFRPHVARLADGLCLTGTCHNDATSVVIEVEGPVERVEEFTHRLRAEAPPLARIMTLRTRDMPVTGADGFVIVGSTSAEGARTLVPPDTAVCADCLDEMRDPEDRRYRHPFITCTNCGPRFTIILDLPYDRPVTTMRDFPMCAACAGEYADPQDRRHHAQPIACHDCGPRLRVTDPLGNELAVGTEECLTTVVAALHGGAVVAIKGLGGYHLACDAASCTATTVLRERKHRPDQPFAVMVRDVETANGIVEVGAAGDVLTSPERPIVLLPRRPGAPVADCVAPGLDELGVLLPYAPVHHLLFADGPDGRPGGPRVLVMTSGNLSGEPLCVDDDDARERLGGIADLFLVHDRRIEVPCEDSVVAWHQTDHGGEAVPLRRSRGFAPLPVELGVGSGGAGSVLAAGAEIKNTVALARDGLAFVSAHVGDLGSLESRAAQARAADQLVRFHQATPDLIVADRHPAYASRAWAAATAADLGVPLHEVQHHHAHLASLAAEHGRLDQPILGVVFDGTGYGCDKGVWGGELLLLGDGGLTAERVAHLGTVRLPGGDEGVRNPARTAALALLAAGVDPEVTPVGEILSEVELGFARKQHASGAGWVPTSSVGRLFDVVSAVLGIRGRVSYEAQAAIELEATARRGRDAAGDLRQRLEMPGLEPAPLVRGLVAGLLGGVPVETLAWDFHVALAHAAADLAVDHARSRDVATVGLTGGVFANRLLLGLMRRRLADAGVEVLTHRLVPANDGGLSLGQVAIGARLQHLRNHGPGNPGK